MQLNAAMFVAPSPAFHAITNSTRLTRHLELSADRMPLIKSLFQLNKPFHPKCLTIFSFEMDKILSLQLNVTYHWIEINIFIRANKYLVNSIKKFSMFPFN